MCHYIRPSDREVENISRMSRESSDFYEGLAKALRPQESQAPSGEGERPTAPNRVKESPVPDRVSDLELA